MSWLAVWLIGIAVADLARAGGRGVHVRGSVVLGSVLAGVAAMAAVTALAGLTAPVDLVVLAASVLFLALWVRFSAQAMSTGEGHWPALAALAGGAVWLVALSGWATPAGGWLETWLAWADPPVIEDGSSTAHVLLVLALLLVNLATANVLVRLVLVSVGAMRPPNRFGDGAEPQPSDQLRGGRLLGPLERLLILGLGLSGQLTAAGLVIAAKGLIRFPELQSKRDDRTTVEAVGIDEVTEYFLVGSFVSWLLALGSLALTR
jgi:hypothetical protein